jgi:hypothetical protein
VTAIDIQIDCQVSGGKNVIPEGIDRDGWSATRFHGRQDHQT